MSHLYNEDTPLHLKLKYKLDIMSNLKYSKDIEFLKDGPWDELYVLTKYWISDLEFYRDDLLFLHHLIDKYFICITKQENLDLVKELKLGLQEMTASVNDLLEKVSRHHVRLGFMVEDSNKKDAGIIISEHQHLEEEMKRFVKSFRKNRKETFKISEYIIDSEELSSIIES